METGRYSCEREANWLDQYGVTSPRQINPSVVGQVILTNSASSVRGPKYVVKKGKTLVLTPDQARRLIIKSRV